MPEQTAVLLPRCGACRFGLVSHVPADPQCLTRQPSREVR